MISKKIKESSYYAFENLSQFSTLTHFVSSRGNGNMNLDENKPRDYILNRKKFLDGLGIQLAQTVFCRQIHGNKVGVIDAGVFKNPNSDGLNIIEDVDALVANKSGICLVIKTADCVPLVFYDPKNNVIGVAHAGWMGTVANIAYETVLKMKQEYGVDPLNLIVGIGPSIGPEDYSVDEDRAKIVKDKNYGQFLKRIQSNNYLLDLWGLNKHQLIEAGVKKENIETSGISTYNSDSFFSHRRKDPEGHFITGVMLK